MLWFIKFMQKRPSDKTIRISRIAFGLILSSALYYNLIVQADAIDSEIFFTTVSESSLEYIKYGFVSLWLIPIFMWATNLCLLKKKHMKYLQMFYAIVLFYVSANIVEGPSLDVDSLVAFMWIFPLIGWITWKCITSNCLKYKEKITKIRV